MLIKRCARAVRRHHIGAMHIDLSDDQTAVPIQELGDTRQRPILAEQITLKGRAGKLALNQLLTLLD